MKRFIACMLALVLAVALAIPACASEYVKFVNKDVLEAHKEPDPDSKVVKKLKGGTKVMLSGNLLLGSKYTSILLEDTKHGGQMEAWVLTKYLADEMPPKYCKHQWGKWRVIDEPTCTHTGEREHTCKVCGTTKTERLPMLDHEFGKWKIVEEATCVEEGERVRTCKICGYEEEEYYYADHEFGKWTVTEEPTCTETGLRVRRCKVCGYEEEQVLDKLPHEFEWKVIKKTTDHSAGVRAKICKVCGYNGGEESFDPKGTLRRNDRGDEVRALQQQLVDQGYLNAGGADGVYGGGTEKAVTQFQKDQGLEPDGVAWPQTIKRLNHDFGPWQTVKEMTRTEAGERVRVCRDCGYEQREAIEPQPWFERGRRGEDIRAMQQIMKQLGYDAGGFDGIYGKKLDTAFASFAADNGLVAQDGVIRPADVDAVVNAWLDIQTAEAWKGEGKSKSKSKSESPVNLALTVTPADKADDSGMVTYSWSLTNLGSARCTFTALLLTFGEKPDFQSEDMVMVLDGVDLRANAANSASGSFTVDMDWGEGNLNFAALAIYDKNGEKWLSNTVSFENEGVPEVKTVSPIARNVDVSRLADGTWPVAFDPGDVFAGKSGIYLNAVHVFTQDQYDAAEIDALKVGDSIVVAGETIGVKSVEKGDAVTINGGLDGDNGVVLWMDEDTGAYRVAGYDDLATYTEQGVTTLVVDESATYTDASDPKKIPFIIRGKDIVGAITNSGDGADFDQYNTTATIENGKVIAISHIYTP